MRDDLTNKIQDQEKKDSGSFFNPIYRELAIVVHKSVSFLSPRKEKKLKEPTTEPLETSSVSQSHGNLLGGGMPVQERRLAAETEKMRGKEYLKQYEDGYLPSTMKSNQKTGAGAKAQPQREIEN